MLKRFTITALAVAMCLSLGTTSFASAPEAVQNPNVRVINQSEHISAQEIQKLSDSVSASFVKEDGTVIPVETEITIEDVATNARSAGNTYRASVRANSKVSSGSNDKNSQGVTASAYAAITWTDVPGIYNNLDYIEGNVDITKGVMSSSKAEYGDSKHWMDKMTYPIGKKTSFSKSVDLQVATPYLVYTVFFKDAGYLEVKAKASVFD